MDKTAKKGFIKYIEQKVIEFMKDNNVPGMAMSFFTPDEVIYNRGFGSRDFENYKPYTSDTLNGFASCTKSFTCLAIMMLAQEGKLQITDPISKYLPTTIGDEEDPITLHHLMSHTSGIPDLGIYQLSAYRRIPDDIGAKYVPMATWEDFFAHINFAEEEIIKRPGEHYYYFNGGYTMLGRIIEKVSGQLFHEFVTQRILMPLGMTRSGFTEDKLEKDKNLSLTYSVLPGEKTPRTMKFPFNQFLHAPGGLISSVNDMMKYIRMVMTDGVHKSKQFVDKGILDKMQEIVWYYPETATSFDKSGYGYGWRTIDGFYDHSLIVHTGGITGGGSLVGFVKELNIGFVGIGTGNFDFQTMLNGIAKLIDQDNEDIRATKIKKYQKQLLGKYSKYQGANKAEIVQKMGMLYFRDDISENLFPLIPRSTDPEETSFYILNPDRTESDVEFILRGDDISFTFLRSLFHRVD